MRMIKSIKELREALCGERNKNKTIGLVPTMGFLHEGHMSLVDRAKQTCDIVVMSIFVNPIQFGPNEDLASYPRDLERDTALASARGVDYLFTPSVSEMYPTVNKTTVTVSDVTESLCGASRPGHFDGVATVVTKLFNIVQPAYAFFGMKDAQQVAIIMQMVDDLNMPVTIVPCPIVREKDGLALSSRNVYLNEEQRRQALVLSRAINEAKDAYAGGEKSAEALKELIVSVISHSPLADIDYVEIRNYPSLTEAAIISGQEVLIALAVRFGNTRLIDNTVLSPVKEEAACFAQ
ncbi:pantoate--beta-alanine ligase [Aneurinibacillus sp. Ricciae_BoGa-3]|uniref:pantoate--beta-alanine ligase n=1 Tax=Aneurinibacillus sp. Ricciae_BoGa-3 TaxID=3022697 RepID=UPI00233FB52B|nr:pantoate--beta-alanine ligase [Aneurinibacillus sp. Ricciae_BoGa-3]WCK56110.1 pantoate--beta-alanine ligase [Aneurinibacillus sp. Ricciae_BoGa-3]